jgi:hypothetical protein
MKLEEFMAADAAANATGTSGGGAVLPGQALGPLPGDTKLELRKHARGDAKGEQGSVADSEEPEQLGRSPHTKAVEGGPAWGGAPTNSLRRGGGGAPDTRSGPW